MKAIVMTEFGPPGVLVEREVEDPSVGPRELLIDVELANVTFVETQIRRGQAPRASMLPALPAIPGNGVGGVVTDAGAEVDPAVVGARVLATTGGSGGYAELVSVPEERAIRVPDQLATTDAVALLSDGRTALGLIERVQLQAGDTALVEAAAGGVGSLLVQLAKAAGARVIAAAGGPRKLAAARSLGADLVVDYLEPGWTREIAGTVDVVFDGVGGAIGRAAFEELRPGGRHCAFGMASGQFVQIGEEEARERGVTLLRGAVLDPEQMARLTASALDRAARGELRPLIGQTLPLRQAADAHEAIESRATVGKTLLVATVN